MRAQYGTWSLHQSTKTMWRNNPSRNDQTYHNRYKIKSSIIILTYSLEVMIHGRRPTIPELYDEIPFQNTHIGRSPLKRNPHNQPAILNKSPIRQRTPLKNLSPAKNYHQVPNTIRYIPNVSAVNERVIQPQTPLQLSNGKNLRYIQGRSQKAYETCRKFDPPKKMQKGQQDQNRRFGKIVDKLNSEKKGGKSNDISQRTSVFADEPKLQKLQSLVRPEGTFRTLVNQVKVYETKSEIKPRSKGKQFEIQEQQNLSCLVYKIKNTNQGQKDCASDRNIPIQFSNVVRRKASKPEVINAIQQEQYKDLNMLLEKINGGNSRDVHKGDDYQVKKSLMVKESLSMDAFL